MLVTNRFCLFLGNLAIDGVGLLLTMDISFRAKAASHFAGGFFRYDMAKHWNEFGIQLAPYIRFGCARYKADVQDPSLNANWVRSI